MADFPAPQSAPGASTAPVSAALLAYVLFAIGAVLEIARSGLLAPAPLMTIFGIIAVIVCYVKRSDAAGTWVASHFTWLIGTFWWSFIVGIIGWIFAVTVIGLVVAVPVWIACAIWVIYRVIRGYLLFKESKPVGSIV